MILRRASLLTAAVFCASVIFACAIRNPRGVPDQYFLSDSLRGATADVTSTPLQHLGASQQSAWWRGKAPIPAEPLWVYNTTKLWDIPESINYQGSPYVPKVIHHGNCGSCYAAAAKDALESAYFRETGESMSMSMQDMIDCSWQYEYHNETNLGCQGGAYQAAFDWARDNGVIPESAGPYANNDSICISDREDYVLDWKPRGWVEVPDDERLIMHALAHVGPLAVSMLTAYPAFDNYSGKGIIVVPPANCTHVVDKKLDHSMFLVGYGTSAFGVPYWVIKNNWGLDWGDAGYYYLFRGRDCGLRTSVSYVV